MKLFRDNFCPVVDARECDDDEDVSKMFWCLWPVNARGHLDKLNKIIDKENASNKETYRSTLKKVSMGNFIIFHSLFFLNKEINCGWIKTKTRSHVES